MGKTISINTLEVLFDDYFKNHSNSYQGLNKTLQQFIELSDSKKSILNLYLTSDEIKQLNQLKKLYQLKDIVTLLVMRLNYFSDEQIKQLFKKAQQREDEQLTNKQFVLKQKQIVITKNINFALVKVRRRAFSLLLSDSNVNFNSLLIIMLINFINETKDTIIDSNQGVNVSLLSSLCTDVEFSNFTKEQARKFLKTLRQTIRLKLTNEPKYLNLIKEQSQTQNIDIAVYPAYLTLKFYWQNSNLELAVNNLNTKYCRQIWSKDREVFSFYINKDVYNCISAILSRNKAKSVNFVNFVNKLLLANN